MGYCGAVVWLLCSVSLAVEVVNGGREVLSVHGSGTTNPSKCFWRVIDKLDSQTKLPTRITFRSVGSGTGFEEFVDPTPIVDFASGDLPLPDEYYDTLTKTNGEEIYQLPVLLSAMSFFVNVPNTEHLNLTACLISKMYRGLITDWNDDEILERNPNMVLPNVGLSVRPFHRLGSTSTTAAVTSYLAAACPSVWPAEAQGPSIDWPEASNPCVGGSAEMTTCVANNEGAIGFIDAGFGHAGRLQEPFLINRDGTTLTSDHARLLGGIESAAAAVDALPASPADPYPLSQFINQPGEFSWPMVAISYIYVRRDLTYIQNPEEQGLLKAFLESMYMEEYMKQCEDDYEFIMVSGQAKKLAQMALDGLILNETAPTWTFETITEPGISMGDYVISLKRNSIADVERASLVAELNVLDRKYNLMEQELDAVLIEMDKLRFERSSLNGAGSSAAAFSTKTTTTSALLVGSLTVLVLVFVS